MSFYKEVPSRKTTLESTLKFDTTPTSGSTNPVTSDGIATAITEAVGGASDALQEQIDDIAEKAGSGYTPKGPASVATLNGLSGQENGWLYTMTDAGTLTDGSLAVTAGDSVAWDEANSVWYKAMDYAPRQYGTNEINNLPTAITAFRTGDVIPVDGPSGTAKMSKDDLLAVTAENALGSIHSLSDTATEADLVSGNYLAIDGSAGTKKLPAELVAKRSVQDELLKKYPYTPQSLEISDDGELLITDEKNNILAKFANGRLITYRGTTPASSKSGNDGELLIVDEDDNILVKFANGGFETSNFTTDTISNKEEKTFVDFRDEGLAKEFFNAASGIFTASGMTLPAGWGNAIFSKKHFSFQDETLSFVVDVGNSNAIIYFGARETLPIKTGLYGSCFKADFSTHTIGLLTNNQFESDPSSVAYKFSKNSVDFSSWDKVILTLTRSERIITARLTNYFTSEYVEVTSTNTTSVGNVDGELYDSIFLATTIDINVENFSFDIPMHSDVLFIGDSVSDGRAVLIGDSWTRKFGDYLGCRCCYAPRAGGQVGTCVEFLLDWISYIKPKIVVCSVGVNGGNTQDGFDLIVSICRQANALLVLNTIYNVASGFSNINETNWNAYNAYILSIKCLHIRFDIASSANKKTPVFNAIDPSYTLVDAVHPTSAGHQILYERALVDVGQIKNLLM